MIHSCKSGIDLLIYISARKQTSSLMSNCPALPLSVLMYLMEMDAYSRVFLSCGNFQQQWKLLEGN